MEITDFMSLSSFLNSLLVSFSSFYHIFLIEQSLYTRQITSSGVPSIHPVCSFFGAFFFPALHTATNPAVFPVRTAFFTAFMEATSLSANNTSIVMIPFFRIYYFQSFPLSTLYFLSFSV